MRSGFLSGIPHLYSFRSLNLTIIRHTSVKVSAGICYGRSDVELSGTYDSEKEIIIENLNGISYDFIYTSPLSRCFKLAADISKDHEVICDNRLSELDFGDWEKRPWEDIYKTPYAEKWFENWMETPCPNGESFIQMVSRVKDFILEKASEHENSDLLIVTHSGVMRIIIFLLQNLNIEEIFKIQPHFGEIIQISFNPDNLSLV